MTHPRCRSLQHLWHVLRVTRRFTQYRQQPALLLGPLLAACSVFESPSAGEASIDYPVTISAHSAGKPVAGVKLLSGKQVLGATDESGKVRLKLKGAEGDTKELSVQCPDGLASPEKPIAVGLRALAKGSPEPKFQAECVSLTHDVVVGLRAGPGTNLPVLYLDEVIGHTNSEGVAHLKMKVAPKEQVTLVLDTSKNPSLRPQNPSLTFVTSGKDEMILLEQKFTVVRKKPKPIKRNIPQPL